MPKSIHSLVVAKWWYSHSIFSFIFISWNTFIKRTFPSFSVRLPSCIIHIEKEDKCLIFFSLYFQFSEQWVGWLASFHGDKLLACFPPLFLSFSPNSTPFFLSLTPSFIYFLSSFFLSPFVPHFSILPTSPLSSPTLFLPLPPPVSFSPFSLYFSYSLCYKLVILKHI